MPSKVLPIEYDDTYLPFNNLSLTKTGIEGGRLYRCMISKGQVKSSADIDPTPVKSLRFAQY